MHLMIKCFYSSHIVISGAFPTCLSHDHMYNPTSMETKLLMNYDFIPNPEFSDQNLRKYSQFILLLIKHGIDYSQVGQRIHHEQIYLV